MLRTFCLAVFATASLAELLPAQGPPIDVRNPLNPVIGGIPVFCTSYGSGQYVMFVPNPMLNDIGRAAPGMPPTIELNPVLLMRLPAKLQLFWYGHECGHHRLGPANSETNADCWSVSVGKQQGLFTREDVAGFAPWFAGNPGSPWGHLPGPVRVQAMLACFDQAPGPGP